MSHGGTTPVAPVDYVKLWVVARSFVLFYLFCGRVEDQGLVHRLCPLAKTLRFWSPSPPPWPVLPYRLLLHRTKPMPFQTGPTSLALGHGI
jgi:hypothetical protein